MLNIYSDLLQRYCEPHRFYHNAQHIANMLNKLNECTNLTKKLNDIKYAIWFHDAVYDPKRQDNEYMSQQLWSDTMPRHVNFCPFLWVSRAILATIDHLPNEDSDIQLFLDLDLSAIGEDYQTFLKNGENIRKEFSHVPEEEFQEGRRKFLENFLERECIFGTEYWRNKCEKQARDNIKQFLKKVSQY